MTEGEERERREMSEFKEEDIVCYSFIRINRKKEVERQDDENGREGKGSSKIERRRSKDRSYERREGEEVKKMMVMNVIQLQFTSFEKEEKNIEQKR